MRQLVERQVELAVGHMMQVPEQQAPVREMLDCHSLARPNPGWLEPLEQLEEHNLDNSAQELEQD